MVAEDIDTKQHFCFINDEVMGRCLQSAETGSVPSAIWWRLSDAALAVGLFPIEVCVVDGGQCRPFDLACGDALVDFAEE